MNENVKLDIGNVVGGIHPVNSGSTGGNHSKVAFPGSAPTPGLSSLLGLHNMAYSPGWENQQFEPSTVQQMAVCLTTGNDGNKSPGITLGYSCAFNNPAAAGGVDITSMQTMPGVAVPGYTEPELGPDFQPTPYAGNPALPYPRDRTITKIPNDAAFVAAVNKAYLNWYGREFHDTGQDIQQAVYVPTAKSPSSAVPPPGLGPNLSINPTYKIA